LSHDSRHTNSELALDRTLIAQPDDEESALLNFLITLAKHKRIVGGLPLLAGIVAAITLLILPNVYTGTARVMPPQPGQSAAVAAFGALATAAGGMGTALGPALGLKNPNDLYVGMLKGHTVADRMIERFELKKRFNTDTLVDTRKALDKATSIRAGRDGLIVIEVDDEDPKIAAAMANAYVEELDRLSQQIAVTEASQRRLFFERELVGVREKLAATEAALRATQEKTGLIQLEGQARAIFDAFADLRARIAAKEVELASIRTFATTHNPSYLRGQQELLSLRGQLDKLERVQPEQNGKGNILVPTAQVPEAGLEYLRRVRDMKYHEALHELLARQYEIAKIEEAKDAALIQLVDRALPPDRRSKPMRGVILVSTVCAAALLAMLLAVFLEAMEKARSTPGGTRRITILKNHLRFW
jgi:tyrosine-protein kinase Etk/Wzc